MNGSSSGFSGSSSGSYYEILNLDSSASEEDIKKAYRRTALRIHPDKNPGREQEFTEKFKDVQQAYETLSNSDLRREYDDQQHQNSFLVNLFACCTIFTGCSP